MFALRKDPWRRWQRFARRAAEIQSIVLLTALYWVVVAPIGLLQKIVRRPARDIGWKTRPPTGAVPIEDARRQS